MTFDWQTLIALGIVALAAAWLLRGLRGLGASNRGCGGCRGCSSSASSLKPKTIGLYQLSNDTPHSDE